MLGFVVGVVIIRLAANPSDGWANLTSIAGSIFSWAPVGGVIGLALALRKRSWPWGPMVVAGLVGAAIPVLAVRDSAVTAWGSAAYCLLVGGFLVWWLRRPRRTNQSDILDPRRRT